MKVTLIVFLSALTLVACNVPEVFTSSYAKASASATATAKAGSKPPGKNCICNKKDCTNVLCEEKNCLCVVKAIQNLLDNKDVKYPKKWLSTYRQLVQERCLCIQGCQNICSPPEFIQCSSAAFDRFICKYQAFAEGIAGEKGFDSFNEDIKRANAECINKDCKPTCSGNANCNPFLTQPANYRSTKACIIKLVQSLGNLLTNKDVKEELEAFEIFCIGYYQQMGDCAELKNSKSQEACRDASKAEIQRSLQILLDNLIKIVGQCSSVSIVSTIKQGAIECIYKKR